MRAELLYNPRLLCERLAELSLEKRRLAKLRGGMAGGLQSGHIDSLELMELLRPLELGTLYDIGANIGTWTLLAKALYPNARIHAFEPLKAHADEFEMATSSLKSVSLHRVALGREPGMTLMTVLDRSDASSLLPITTECARQYDLSEKTTENVTVQRLDDIICSDSLALPDLLKLDIQGYELEALRGGEKAMANARAILVEVSFMELYKGQCLFHHLVSFLAERGFQLFALGKKTALGEVLLQADALFVTDSTRSFLQHRK